MVAEEKEGEGGVTFYTKKISQEEGGVIWIIRIPEATKMTQKYFL